MPRPFLPFRKSVPSPVFDLAALFIVTLTILFMLMDRMVNVYDEGIILTNSMLVHAGKFIHRDFYANYGPGEFVLLSWLYDVFGQKVIVERLLDLCVRTGIVLLVFASCKRYVGRAAGVLAAAACVCWLALVGNYGYPVYPALFCALGSTMLIVREHAAGVPAWRRRATGLLAGLLAGSVGLFRYDIGFALLAGHALYAGGRMITGRKPSSIRKVLESPAVLAYALGVAIPVGGVALSYAVHGALHDFFYDVVLFPSEYYAPTRRLPFPPLRGMGVLEGIARLSIYLPVVIVAGIALAWFGGRSRSYLAHGGWVRPEPGSDERLHFVGALLALAVLFYFKGLVRVSIQHLVLSLIPAVLALVVYAAAARRMHWTGMLTAGLLIVTGMSASAFALRHVTDANRVILDKNWLLGYAGKDHGFVIEKTPADRIAGKPLHPLLFVEPAREAALDDLVRHTEQNDRVFVGLSRHDRVYINDVSAYFFAQRLPATKWHHFDPGLQSSRRIQQEIIADLERNKPAYIWLDATWQKVREPNQSALSSGVNVLDDYLGKHDSPGATFGTIATFLPKQ